MRAKSKRGDCFVASLAAELHELKENARKVSFRSGQIVFREGDPGDGIYVVERGCVEISAVIGGQERRVLSHLGPGEFFGEMAVVDEQPRSATATAEKATVLSFISRDDTWRLFTRSPRLLVSLMREFSLRMREFDRRYLHEVFQEERLALVGRFAQSIVHDFKNPLNVIGMAGDLAGAEDATQAERSEAKATIRKQVDRLAEMIGEVLEFTRGASSPERLVESDYREFVAHALAEIAPDASRRAVQIEVQRAAPSVRLRMDRQRLLRVFFNLINNAMDAMPSGGTIALRFRVAGKEVITELEDSGPGIAPEIAARLFQPFATHGKAHGTGLGLAICKKIIEDHKGRLTARSAPGRGAIFSFTLPRLGRSAARLSGKSLSK